MPESLCQTAETFLALVYISTAISLLWFHENSTILSEDGAEIQRLNGRHNDYYHQWRLRCKIALNSKSYWTKLQANDCDQDTKDKSLAMMVAALGDSALRVCSAMIGEPIKMSDLPDKRFASNRMATPILVLKSMYSKKFVPRYEMPKFVHEFEFLLAQLEGMRSETAIPEAHKAPLLLGSIGNDSVSKSTIVALRTKNTDQSSWKAVTADLI